MKIFNISEIIPFGILFKITKQYRNFFISSQTTIAATTTTSESIKSEKGYFNTFPSLTQFRHEKIIEVGKFATNIVKSEFVGY